MDDTKRLLLAVGLCLGIVLVWQAWFGPRPPAKPAPGEKSAAPSSTAGAAGGGSAAAPSASAPAPAGPEQTATVRTASLEVVAGSLGGLRAVRLLDPQFRTESDGRTVPIDLVQPGAPGESLAVDVDGALGIGPPWRVDAGPFGITGAAHAVTVGHVIVWRAESPSARVTRTLTLPERGYAATLDVRIENLSSKPQAARMSLHATGWQDPAVKASMTKAAVRVWQPTCLVNGSLEAKAVDKDKDQEATFGGDVAWAGVGDKYFLLAVAAATGPARDCRLSAASDGALAATLRFAEESVAPGGSATHRFTVYLGPKSLDALDAVTVDHQPARLDKAVNYGRLAVLCRPMIWLLRRFQAVVQNWGVAILLLTLAVKLATLYWTQRSMKSMRALQKLKPEMDRIKEKYGNDQQRMNQEVWALYKRHGVNPLGGCFPMLLQMPIWYALYATLAQSVELYRARFLYLKDLSAPDPYFAMPIVLGGLSFWQSKMSTPAGTPVDPQQKMMQYMMPGMFLMFSLFVPSGLTVYWLANTVLTMIHQWYMNRADGGLVPATAGARAR